MCLLKRIPFNVSAIHIIRADIPNNVAYSIAVAKLVFST